MSDIETHTLIVLSTAHITQTTGIWLEKQGSLFAGNFTDPFSWPDLSMGLTPYGWLVYVTQESVENALPGDLSQVLNFAHERGAAYVLLDRDGGTIEELPTYEW